MAFGKFYDCASFTVLEAAVLVVPGTSRRPPSDLPDRIEQGLCWKLPSCISQGESAVSYRRTRAHRTSLARGNLPCISPIHPCKGIASLSLLGGRLVKKVVVKNFDALKIMDRVHKLRDSYARPSTKTINRHMTIRHSLQGYWRPDFFESP